MRFQLSVRAIGLNPMCYNSNETLTAELFNDAICSTTVSDCYLKVALYLRHPRK